MADDVLATGLGVLSAVGEGVPAFAHGLRNGTSGISHDASDGLGVAARLKSRPFAERLAALPLSSTLRDRARSAAAQASRSVQTGLIVALEAWAQSGLETAGLDLAEIGLVVAGHNLGQRQHFAMVEKFQGNPEYIPARYALEYMDSYQLGVISEVLQLRGEGAVIGGASASGNVALLQAHRQVRAGLTQACLVVAPLAELSLLEVQAFRHTGAMGGRRFAEHPAEASRPFDAAREGFIYGEAAAAIVLEGAASARSRSAPVWGEFAGGASCLDGNRRADPSIEGESRAMARALAAAGVAKEAVTYISAHGTGSNLGDEIEAAAIRQFLGPRAGEVWVNATKGLTGHGLSAAGVVEAVAVLIQLREGFLHPNANLTAPIDSTLRFVGSTSQPATGHIALSNAFGFGGINTSLVFRAC